MNNFAERNCSTKIYYLNWYIFIETLSFNRMKAKFKLNATRISQRGIHGLKVA